MNHPTMIMRAILTTLAVLYLWAAPVAHAHGGPPRLEPNVHRINPGGTLEVRGVNLAADESINLTLIGNGSEFPLGAATSDAHGDFVQAVALPADLAEGVYTVRASLSGQPAAEAALTIFGPPTSADKEGGHREEEEPLLIPLPTSPRAVPTTVSQPVALVESPAPPLQTASWWPLAFGAVLAAALGLAVVARRKTMSAR